MAQSLIIAMNMVSCACANKGMIENITAAKVVLNIAVS
jgi:hypothetical protein